MTQDLAFLVGKWLNRLAWIGSVAVLQILELHRYLDGKTYRPLFALYAGLLLGAVLWFALKTARSLRRRAQPGMMDSNS